MALSVDTTPAKHVTVLRNGDNKYEGRRFIVSRRRYRTFDSLLSDITNQISAPFGAVRRLYTPKGRRQIRGIEDIEGGATYVAGGSERFKKLDYSPLRLPGKNWSTLASGRPGFLADEPPPLVLPKKNKRYAQRSAQFYKVQQPVQFTVYRNGMPTDKGARFLLKDREMKSFETVLSIVSSKIRLVEGAVRRLYTPEGGSLVGPHEIVDGGVYVACGHRRFIPGPYGEAVMPVRTVQRLPAIKRSKETVNQVSPRTQSNPLPAIQRKAMQTKARSEKDSPAPIEENKGIEGEMFTAVSRGSQADIKNGQSFQLEEVQGPQVHNGMARMTSRFMQVDQASDLVSDILAVDRETCSDISENNCPHDNEEDLQDEGEEDYIVEEEEEEEVEEYGEVQENSDDKLNILQIEHSNEMVIPSEGVLSSKVSYGDYDDEQYDSEDDNSDVYSSNYTPMPHDHQPTEQNFPEAEEEMPGTSGPRMRSPKVSVNYDLEEDVMVQSDELHSEEEEEEELRGPSADHSYSRDEVSDEVSNENNTIIEENEISKMEIKTAKRSPKKIPKNSNSIQAVTEESRKLPSKSGLSRDPPSKTSTALSTATSPAAENPSTGDLSEKDVTYRESLNAPEEGSLFNAPTAADKPGPDDGKFLMNAVEESEVPQEEEEVEEDTDLVEDKPVELQQAEEVEEEERANEVS